MFDMAYMGLNKLLDKQLGKLGLRVALLMAMVATISHCGQKVENHSEQKFYGKDNQQVEISFETYLWYAIPQGWEDSVDELLESDFRSEIDEQIDLQTAHMFSAFTNHREFAHSPGIIQNTPDIEVTGIAKVPGTNFAKVTYTFSDLAVFHKDVFKKYGRKISFWLPKDVVGIYQKGFVGRGTVNLCTDEHYNSEGDFWYFWNPKQEGCPIENKDMVRVKATLKPIASTRVTYPEYDKLYGANGNRKKLKVVAIMGIDESFRAGDVGRDSYLRFVQNMIDGGYTLESRTARTASFSGGDKSLYDLEMTVQLLSPKSSLFDAAAIEGLQTADIFLYAGHSGLGGNLAPGRFEDFLGKKLKLPKDKYQILMFQGCSTFSYYNESYFELKQTVADPSGKKNMDIMTTGMGLLFDLMPDQNFVALDHLLSGKRPSWQKIINDVYAVDPETTALHQINGDEDK